MAVCKTCRSASQKQTYEKRKQYYRMKALEWYHANKERASANRKAWVERHPGYAKAYYVEWREKQKQKRQRKDNNE